jgi:D-serine deaminase-like pyridoxal phosphate-dependent protein
MYKLKGEFVMQINTPFVYVDLDIMENNLKQMANRLNNMNIDQRPHIKAHKSIEIATKQINYGAIGITVAKLSEAEIMAEAGFNNILIAYPIIGQLNLKRIKNLHTKTDIIATIDSIQGATGLSEVGEEVNKRIRVLIEIDGGSHRGGRQPGKDLKEFAMEVKNLKGIEVIGVLGYVGQIYNQSSIEDLKKVAKDEARLLIESANLMKEIGFNVSIISGGSTISSMFSEGLSGITESRAGNYAFFDMNAVNLGVASVDDCALRVRSRIVSNPLPGYATIDAGSKTLTTDLSNKGNGYGYIYGKENISIVKLNEEHGYLRYDPNEYDLQIGDEIDIIPNHSCVLANLCDFIYGFRGDKFERKIRIDARGMNY